MLVIDDYSRMIWVAFLREKCEALEKLKSFKAMAENETSLKIKCLRSDRGGEFTSQEFNSFCEEHGIKRQLSTPQTPQQNGFAERNNRTILDATRTMMMEGNVSQMYWSEVVSTIVYTLNWVNVNGNSGKTPL